MTRRAPVLVLGIALFLALAVLPSSLNLPQTNPSTTLEYAPVPPADEDNPPPGGNLASLGLASSGTLGASFDGGLAAPPAVGGATGAGKNPSTKRCVGKPPKQTEDPMAPPCVAFFQGDNGGPTYQGVTREEIRVIAPMCWNCLNEDDTSYAGPPGQYCDVDLPPDSDPACFGTSYGTNSSTGRDYIHVKVVRALARYFEERFQTYGRHVHFYVTFPHDTARVENRRADAAQDFARIKPFAAYDRGNLNLGGHRDVYASEMARRGVVNVLNQDPQPASLMRKHPNLLWQFGPDVEHWAEMYVDYLCRRVAPYPVSHAQGGRSVDGRDMNGTPRTYGLLRRDDPEYPQLAQMADLVKAKLGRCGITLAAEATQLGFGYDTGAAANMAKFREEGVTTILSVASDVQGTSKVATTQSYYPEVVIAGDGYIDRGSIGQLQDASFFRNAWVVTPYQLREDASESTRGFQACREADPAMTRADIIPYCQFFYRDFFLLYLMLQVAGPRLSPDAIAAGLRAIPPVSSTDPYKASCYFDPGDFTCTKDAMEQWWDPQGSSPQDAAPGCWRMVASGRRYRPGEWPAGDEVFRNRADPCNGAGAFFAR